MAPLSPALAQFVTDALARRGTAGAAVALFDRNGLIGAQGYGLAERTKRIPVTPTTIFRVASVSKLLTTAVVLRAVQSGRVELDAAANSYLERDLWILDPQGSPSDATVAQLLSHTSGLGPSIGGVDLGAGLTKRVVNGAPPRSLDEVITGLRTQREPGERIVYANSGMNVLGAIAARAFESTFETAAAREVLGPLGMDASSFTTRRSGIGVATHYGRLLPPGVGTASTQAMQLVATPMGGLTTNVVDLARFGAMVLSALEDPSTDSVVAPSLIAQATTLRARNHPDLQQGFGLGFRVRPLGDRVVVGHDGNMPGVSSQLLMSPRDGVGVVVLTNGFALGVPHGVALAALCEVLQIDLDRDAADTTPHTSAAADATALVGRYRVDGISPPGIAGTVVSLSSRLKIVAEPNGVLRVDGNNGYDGVMRLHPSSTASVYRVDAPVDGHTNAVVQHDGAGTKIWLAHTGLFVSTR